MRWFDNFFFMDNFGLFCDGYLDSKFKNKECCYAYHLMTNCIYDVQSRKSCNKFNNYCTKHLAQSEYMIRMSPVDKLIGENRKKMKTVGRHTSVVPLNEKPVIVTPRHRNGKSIWKECFTERRQSRRLSNLPPLDIVIKSENEEVKTLYDHKSFRILRSSIKTEPGKQIKCEVIDDIDSNNQGAINKPLEPDLFLNKKQNCRQLKKKKIKIEPNDDFSLPSLSDQNKLFLDLDKSPNTSVESIYDVIFDEDSTSSLLNKETQLSPSRTIRLINKVIFGRDSADIHVLFGQQESSSKAHLKITPDDETSTSLNAETQQSLNSTVKPINDVMFDEDSTDIHLSFGQHESSSKANLKITPDDETSSSLNEEFQHSQNNTVSSINDVIFGKDLADIYMSFGQHESSSKADLKITPDDETSSSLNEEPQHSQNNTVSSINDVIFGKDLADIHMSFGQHESSSNAHLKITPGDNETSISLNEETQISLNNTVKSINDVTFDEDATGINVSFGQHESSSNAHLKITPGNNETSISLNEETQLSLNNTVKTINDVTFDEDATGINVPFCQHGSISKAHLEITPDDENSISINKETQQMFKSIESVSLNQNPVINNPSCNVGVFKPLNEIWVEIENNDLTRDKNNQIDEKKTCSKSFPKLRVVSPTKLFKSPSYATNPENKLKLNYEHSVTQTSVPFKSISNPNVTDSEQVNTNNYSSISHNNSINDNQNSNLETCGFKIVECWSMSTNDRHIYSEKNKEKTNREELANEIHTKTTVKAKISNLDHTYLSVNNSNNFEHTRSQPKQIYEVTGTKDRLSTNLTNSINTRMETKTNLLPQKKTYSEMSVTEKISTNLTNSIKTRMETKTNLLPQKKTYSEMSVTEKMSTNLTNSIKTRMETKTNLLPQKKTYSEMSVTEKMSTNLTNSINTRMETKTNLLPQKKTYSEMSVTEKISTNLTNSIKTRMETKTNLLPQKKTYSEMSVTEKKLYKQKLNYITALGLVPVDKIKNALTKEIKDTKLPLQPKTSENHIEQADNLINCAKLKRSFILEFPNEANEVVKHKAIPVLLPDKSSGSSIHVERTCSDTCSSCHCKFGLLDVPYHIAQIKDPDYQKVCLENATHLVGPKSCLCAACFLSIEKQSCNFIPKNTCVVLSCNQIGNSILKSSWMDQIKHLFVKEGVILRTWTSKQESIPICKIHFDQVEKMTQCQLCGNQNLGNFKVTKEELPSFQQILVIDKISYELNCDLFLCKPCCVYLEWRVRENENISKQPQHHQTDLKRINAPQKIKLPEQIKKKKRTITTDCRLETVPKLIHYRMDESSRKLKLVASKPAANNVHYKPYKDSTKPTYKKPNFVPVLKPVDDLEFLASLTSDPTRNYYARPPPNTITVHPYDFRKKPLSIPALTPMAKTRKPKYQSRYMAFLMHREMELFNNLVKPYPSPRDFISHLLKLEKFRTTGHLVLKKNPSKNTFVSKTVLPSNVNNKFVNNNLILGPQNVNSKVSLKNSKNEIAMKSKVDNVILGPQNVNSKVSGLRLLSTLNNSKNQIAMKSKVDNVSMVNERRTFTQASKSQIFIPVSTMKHVPIASLSKSIIYKPIRLHNNDDSFDSNNRKQIIINVPGTMTNINSAATIKTPLFKKILNPKAVIISNTDASSKRSAISQFTVTTNSLSPLTPRGHLS